MAEARPALAAAEVMAAVAVLPRLRLVLPPAKRLMYTSEEEAAAETHPATPETAEAVAGTRKSIVAALI